MADAKDGLVEANRVFNLNSTMWARMNRDMRKNRQPPSPAKRQPAVNGPGPRIYRAHLYTAGKLVPDTISPWPGHEFVKYATPWERKRSILTSYLADRFEPVVQEVLEGFALVIGHRGWVGTTRLIAPRGLPVYYHPGEILRAGYPLFVLEDEPSGKTSLERLVPDGWISAGFSDQSAEVLTTVDGQVLAILDGRTRGPEAMDVTPLDLIIGLRLLVGLGVAATSTMVRVMARKEASQAARTVFAGPTPTLAAAATAEAAAAGPSFNGLMVTPGYDPRMGIPRGHFPAMVEAARETNTVAIFRANKKNAITLIEKGAVGKPMWAKFKTDPDTGVLTAKAWPEYATAHKHGHYTVSEDGKSMFMMVNGTRKEAPLPKDVFWKVQPGQVIHPNGKPVVGDYDLLGVIPLEAAGRNMVLVPKDAAKGDWMGPDVARYQEAVNRRLDQPRVLHGAQDQFHNQQWGGFTDDVAYAVFPDGNAYVIAGKAEQEVFYNVFGRKTALGSHPRPSPGTPVMDELAARRRR